MEKPLSRQPDYLDAYIRTAQYLSGMKTQQDIWAETGKVLVSFFGADVGAFGTVRQDGSIVANHWSFSERFAGRRELEDDVREAIAEVMETGFITMRVILTPAPLSLAFLPIIRENRVVAVMLAGHETSGTLPKELLNIYLAVAGLVSTTAERLASERELRRHRLHLEQLVCERTAELTRSNELLQQEISERRLAEEALRASEEHYRAVVEDQTEVISRFTVDGTLIFVNEVFCRFFGKNSRELLGRKWQPEALAEDVPPIEERLRSLSPANPVVVIENRVFSGTGQVRWMQFVNRGFFDDEGLVVEIQSVGRDVTDRKRAEAERMEMERRLLHSQKLESLGVLAGGIAHDFNNLLTVILGNLELTQLEVPVKSTAQRHIDSAMKACQRAAKLICQMLDYAGKGQFLLRSIDINNVVHENAALFRTSIARNIKLKIATSPDLPRIMADRNQIEQVVMNLIINAAEAIGADPGVITIGTGLLECDDGYLSRSRIEEKPSAGWFVYLEVSDSGCGMNEETVARLFDPFFTTKFMGRGLGMSAVLGIVRTHCGAILLESEPGRGAVFRILFPVIGEAGSPAQEIPVTEQHSGISGTDAGLVLVVDDEEDVRDLCMEFVELLGYRAVGAADGMEALRIFTGRASEIDLVILDMTMPNMDGVSAFHAMRCIRSDVEVILSSGYSEENAAGRFAGDRPAGFIQKPFKFEDLRAKICRKKNPLAAAERKRPT